MNLLENEDLLLCVVKKMSDFLNCLKLIFKLNYYDNPFTGQNIQQFSFMDVWDGWRELNAVIWIGVSHQEHFCRMCKKC